MLFTSYIKNNKKFGFLYKKGTVIVTVPIVAYVRPNKKPYNNIGITTGKKIGNAVRRNRVKRIIRAAYRECEVLFPIGYDIIFVARKAALHSKSSYVSKTFKKKVIPEIEKLSSGKNR